MISRSEAENNARIGADLVEMYAGRCPDVLALTNRMVEFASTPENETGTMAVTWRDIPEDNCPNHLIFTVLGPDGSELGTADLNDLLPPEHQYDGAKVYEMITGDKVTS